MTLSTHTRRLFPAISTDAINRASELLVKTNTAASKATDKYLESFQSRTDGVFYRSVEDMRSETSRLRFSNQISGSASVISEGTVHQSVYEPNWVPAVGFLISGEASVNAISEGLFLETPKNQSEEEILKIRQTIVNKIKQGDTSTPYQPTLFYSPRQSGVNEADVAYGSGHVPAYALPIAAEQLSTIEGPLSRQSPKDIKDQAEILRLVAQLTYAIARMGVKPVFTFHQGQLKRLQLSKAQWADVLSKLNQINQDQYLLKVSENYSDLDRPKALGLTQAVEQFNALDQSVDLHEVKHIGGAFTRLPVDLLFAFSSLFSSKSDDKP